MSSTTWDRHRRHASAYDVLARGFNYRMDEIHASLGRARLRRLDAQNRARAELDGRYRAALEGIAGVVPTAGPEGDAESSHHLFTVVLDPGPDRDAVREQMGARGIQTSVHYPPSHRFAIYSEPSVSLPRTEAYADRTLTLPLFPHMASAQQDLVVDSLRGALAAKR
jgi:dTDP-4-amino-4,6-dideoxygalactose transaminase